jgi:hypothetical protein
MTSDGLPKHSQQGVFIAPYHCIVAQMAYVVDTLKYSRVRHGGEAFVRSSRKICVSHRDLLPLRSNTTGGAGLSEYCHLSKLALLFCLVEMSD